MIQSKNLLASSCYAVLYGMAVLLPLFSQTVSAACQCKFDGNDAADCVVYGQLGDGVLIPWLKASQECLDVYNIKVESVSSTQLLSIFPSADGNNGNPSAFVNWLKNDSGSSSNTIKIFFVRFWDDQNGIAVLKDSITVDGTSHNCEASSTSCYDAIKVYFGEEPGASEMVTIGKQLHAKQANDKDVEQSTIRIRLCQEADTLECGDLDVQVKQIKSEQPEKACSAFGLGPATAEIPPCEVASSPTSAGVAMGTPTQSPVVANPKEPTDAPSGSQDSRRRLWLSALAGLYMGLTVVF